MLCLGLFTGGLFLVQRIHARRQFDDQAVRAFSVQLAAAYDRNLYAATSVRRREFADLDTPLTACFSVTRHSRRPPCPTLGRSLMPGIRGSDGCTLAACASLTVRLSFHHPIWSRLPPAVICWTSNGLLFCCLFCCWFLLFLFLFCCCCV